MSVSTALRRMVARKASRSAKKASLPTPDLSYNALVREAEMDVARKASGVASNYPAEHMHVIGLDEAGVGAIAGPLVAAAVYIPHDVVVPGLLDSKQLSGKDRREVFDMLMQHPDVEVHCAIETPEMINAIGHLTFAHMNVLASAFVGLDNKLTAKLQAAYGVDLRSTILQRAVQSKMLHDPTVVARLQSFHPVVSAIVDGAHAPLSMTTSDAHFSCSAVPKADGSCAAVAAASIVSKVFRDNLMLGYHTKFPHYGFDEHKGYETDTHAYALQLFGACSIHRDAGQVLTLPHHCKRDEMPSDAFF